MSDCTCPVPKQSGHGTCVECGGFACMYAGRGRTRCSSAICDCFIETHPDSPFALHPEDFIVAGVRGKPIVPYICPTACQYAEDVGMPGAATPPCPGGYCEHYRPVTHG